MGLLSWINYTLEHLNFVFVFSLNVENYLYKTNQHIPLPLNTGYTVNMCILTMICNDSQIQKNVQPDHRPDSRYRKSKSNPISVFFVEKKFQIFLFLCYKRHSIFLQHTPKFYYLVFHFLFRCTIVCFCAIYWNIHSL